MFLVIVNDWSPIVDKTECEIGPYLLQHDPFRARVGVSARHCRSAAYAEQFSIIMLMISLHNNTNFPTYYARLAFPFPSDSGSAVHIRAAAQGRVRAVGQTKDQAARHAIGREDAGGAEKLAGRVAPQRVLVHKVDLRLGGDAHLPVEAAVGARVAHGEVAVAHAAEHPPVDHAVRRRALVRERQAARRRRAHAAHGRLGGAYHPDEVLAVALARRRARRRGRRRWFRHRTRAADRRADHAGPDGRARCPRLALAVAGAARRVSDGGVAEARGRRVRQTLAPLEGVETDPVTVSGVNAVAVVVLAPRRIATRGARGQTHAPLEVLAASRDAVVVPFAHAAAVVA
ncbi:hypothetical protein ACEPPN_014193 [Leptodophora sp. 'Broadleaf-Isolate-01']